ncbi:putative ABC exporter domain-containing protein [Desulfosporosinus sp. FKB]|uniref:putative ABC transporter permease subunit n=1 Tax=Desulfosporosinus sp. FKB TaxID=1969835 RepID=UPI000B4A3650|nr:putative ABC exporter domain-containing protein [Desulfosporosinus sp. FKB]
MKILLPPPLESPPPEQSFWQNFLLLLGNQLRVSWNKLRHRPVGALMGMAGLLIGAIAIIASLGIYAYGSLKALSPNTVQGFLSMLFMVGLGAQIFFGITGAFVALYMSDDLELLFMAPVPIKAVFAVKSLVIIGSNFLTVVLFAFLPGLFCGLLFKAGVSFYILVLLVGLGLWAIGTAIAELINLLVMRIIPPHRSKEAIGFIGALAGIIIAISFQLPNMLINSRNKFDIGSWLEQQKQMLSVMKFFPWGWGSSALVAGVSQNFLGGLAWSLLILLVGILLFLVAFNLVEKGFRRGFISLSQGERGKRRKAQAEEGSGKLQKAPSLAFLMQDVVSPSSPWLGMWAVAKKDLLSMKRDTREWFGYLVPLIIMLFFVGQFLFSSVKTSGSTLMTVLIMYTIMFSGNMALQSFGREGESDWLLNSVPLAGWPVVWGKLLAAILPTLVLMEALLVGTALAIGVSKTLIIALVVGAVFLALGSSSIGLFYSINNCRYNPDTPQQRIAPGASLFMYLINLFFILLLALGLTYLFLPSELVFALRDLPAVTYEGGLRSGLFYGIYLLSRPLLWSTAWRVFLGVIVTGGIWAAMFFGFMAATVRQSRKGFRVEIIAGRKKRSR